MIQPHKILTDEELSHEFLRVDLDILKAQHRTTAVPPPTGCQILWRYIDRQTVASNAHMHTVTRPLRRSKGYAII